MIQSKRLMAFLPFLFFSSILSARTIAVSNLVPLTAGLSTELSFSVRTVSNHIDTNYSGTILVRSSSPDTQIDPSEILVLRGNVGQTVSIRETGPAERITLTFTVQDDEVEPLSTNLPVIQVEDLYEGRTLIVNELLPDSDSDPLYEWVEFYNNAQTPFSLTNCCIQIYGIRSTEAKSYFKVIPSSAVVPPGPLVVPAGGYLLYVRSLSHFRLRYPDVYSSIANRTGGYSNTLILSSEFFMNENRKNLSSTGSTVYVVSNLGLTTPLVSLFCYGDWGIRENISLARKSSASPVQDRNNWSLTADGTPGLKNEERSPPPVPHSGPVTVRPEAVSAEDESIRIAFLPEQALSDLRVCVLTSSGRVARVLLDRGTATRGDELVLDYDLKDGNGIRLNRGLYFITFSGRNKNGNTLRRSAPFALGAGP